MVIEKKSSILHVWNSCFSKDDQNAFGNWKPVAFLVSVIRLQHESPASHQDVRSRSFVITANKKPVTHKNPIFDMDVAPRQGSAI